MAARWVKVNKSESMEGLTRRKVTSKIWGEKVINRGGECRVESDRDDVEMDGCN